MAKRLGWVFVGRTSRFRELEVYPWSMSIFKWLTDVQVHAKAHVAAIVAVLTALSAATTIDWRVLLVAAVAWLTAGTTVAVTSNTTSGANS